jgi:hypothetical protein
MDKQCLFGETAVSLHIRVFRSPEESISLKAPLMSESPYKPPGVESMAPATTAAGVDREKLRAVAKY